ncbi:hypothetical protein KW807_02490 [Candidatus Parcubacteria bacterium]|nr:hypothetical protein [Candidatus Parcubacteria bacterium]
MIHFIAADYGPSKALEMVAEEIRRASVRTLLNLMGVEGAPVAPETSMLVSGMAFTATGATKEITAINQAISQGIPVALYADTFDCAGREWFEGVREKINILFTPTKGESKKAENLFPHSNIIATGNPLWEASVFPNTRRAEIRTQLEIPEGTKLLFSPLRKETELNERCGLQSGSDYLRRSDLLYRRIPFWYAGKGHPAGSRRRGKFGLGCGDRSHLPESTHDRHPDREGHG